MQAQVEQIFSEILEFKETQEKEIIQELPVGGAQLYRARSVQKLKDAEAMLMEPTKNLGPPPFKKATAGRINPAILKET